MIHARTLASVVATAAVLSLGAFAHSAAAGTSHGRQRCTHPCTSSPGREWSYRNYYFFKADCLSAGQHGKDDGTWTNFMCKSPDVTTDYDLWVVY